MDLVGLLLDTVGTILIAYTALRVHDRVRKEHKIDGRVTREMQRERALGIVGVVLILLGFALQVLDRIV